MIKGEAVIVQRYEQTGADSHNNPTYEWVDEEVGNVLTAPGTREDIPDANRPEGVIVAWTCHFPKTFTGSLRGCRVKVRDDEPRAVIGDPQPYMGVNTPGPWNRPVELEGTDG